MQTAPATGHSEGASFWWLMHQYRCKQRLDAGHQATHLRQPIVTGLFEPCEGKLSCTVRGEMPPSYPKAFIAPPRRLPFGMHRIVRQDARVCDILRMRSRSAAAT